MSIESVMPSNHLSLCLPLLPPSTFPSIRVFSNEPVLCIRWPKYWSFRFKVPYCRWLSWPRACLHLKFPQLTIRVMTWCLQHPLFADIAGNISFIHRTSSIWKVAESGFDPNHRVLRSTQGFYSVVSKPRELARVKSETGSVTRKVRRSQRKRPLQMAGGGFNRQGTHLRGLSWSQETSESPHMPALITKVCREAVLGFNHLWPSRRSQLLVGPQGCFPSPWKLLSLQGRWAEFTVQGQGRDKEPLKWPHLWGQMAILSSP